MSLIHEPKGAARVNAATATGYVVRIQHDVVTYLCCSREDTETTHFDADLHATVFDDPAEAAAAMERFTDQRWLWLDIQDGITVTRKSVSPDRCSVIPFEEARQ